MAHMGISRTSRLRVVSDGVEGGEGFIEPLKHGANGREARIPCLFHDLELRSQAAPQRKAMYKPY